MGFRHSEYERLESDTYITPKWVWDILYDHFERFRDAYECCPANAQFDFCDDTIIRKYVATNPPYGRQAERIARHALHVTELAEGSVALLLPHAWDTAKLRTGIFGYPFHAKLVITERIHWANLEIKRDKRGNIIRPASTHAWYIWDWSRRHSMPIMLWS